MGWGRTLLLGNLGTQLNLDDVERDLQGLRQYLVDQHAEHDSQEARITALQKDNHELKLYLVTLIRLLVSKNTLNQEDLNRFVNVLDPADKR